MCQPGRPSPQGEDHAGSPALLRFQRTKSAAWLGFGLGFGFGLGSGFGFGFGFGLGLALGFGFGLGLVPQNEVGRLTLLALEAAAQCTFALRHEVGIAHLARVGGKGE